LGLELAGFDIQTDFGDVRHLLAAFEQEPHLLLQTMDGPRIQSKPMDWLSPRFVCLMACMSLPGVALAQTKQPDNFAFDQIGLRHFEHQAAPGFALLVWSHGSIVFAKGYGFADLAGRSPVTPDTRFAVGSITKQFTALSILLLVERRQVSLEDKLGEFVPGMPNANELTLRMLLNQVSGLHNYPNTHEHPWPLRGRVPPEKIVKILMTDKPDFAPGAKWEYSNTNYAMLAQVVSRVSGVSYSDFLSRNIFAPLGMTSSGNGFDAQGDTATPYKGSAGSFAPAKPEISLDLFYGAGSIVSTARDLARWDAALVSNKLLTAQLTRELWTNATLPSGQSTNYAMGFVATTIGSHREVWHNGYTPHAGGYCLNAIFPDDDLAVVVLSNAPDQSFRGEPEKMAQEVLALYDPPGHD
jgi:D-alanyl-D-alanine carboxypeptidase